MGVFKQAVPTEKGVALLTKVLAGTAELEFTRIVTGDSVLEGDLSLKTNIGNIKQEQPASTVWLEGNSSIKVSAGFSNDAITQGYYVRNIGLYARDPDIGEILYSISVADDDITSVDWMPPFSESSVSSLAVDLVIELSNTENAKVSIDATAGATVAQIVALSRRADNLRNDLTALGTQFYEHVKHHEIKTYTDLASIGLVVGSETIDGIAKAMPEGSILMIPVGSSNSAIYPENGNGTLWVRYRNADRALFEYISTDTDRVYRGHYISSTKTWSGWTDYTGRALYVDDLMGNFPVPTFVQWDANTLNTPYDHGFIDYSEGFAICFGSISNDQTVVAWTKCEPTPECYMIRVAGGKVSDWEKFISSSGGRLKGQLLLGGGKGLLDSNDNYSVLQSRNNTDEYRDIRVLRSGYGKVPIGEAVKLANVTNGVETLYNLYGEHNRQDLHLPQLSIQTYTGDGSSGANNKNKVTFNSKPLFVVITGSGDPTDPNECSLMFGYGSIYERGANPASGGYVNIMTWGNNYVEWYSKGTQSDQQQARMQKNSKDVIYTVVAILE